MVAVAFVLARPSGGLPHAHPVGCPVAAALEAIPLHESFQEAKRMPVALLPVSGDSPSDLPENMAGQMIDAHPRQNQKTLVIRDQRQPAHALLSRPAYPSISGGALPGRRAQAGNAPGLKWPLVKHLAAVVAEAERTGAAKVLPIKHRAPRNTLPPAPVST